MRMLVSIIAAGIALSLTAFPSAWGQSAEEKGYRIAKTSSDQGKGYRDYAVSGKMALRNRAGTSAVRDFDFKSMEAGRGDLSMLVFNLPGDIRDTALLTHEHRQAADEQWIFLPAERRVKRIAGSGRSGSFVGSEFAYEDMVDQDIDKYTHKWVTDDECCHIVDRVSKHVTGYARQRVWYNKNTYTVAKIEYYNSAGTLYKTLVATGYQKYHGRFWRASTVTMSNHLTGKETVLSWSGHRFSVGLGANEFTTRALERVR